LPAPSSSAGSAEGIGRVRSAAAATALMSVMTMRLRRHRQLPGAAGAASRIRHRCGRRDAGGSRVHQRALARARTRPLLLALRDDLPIGLMMTGQIGALVVPAFGWQVMFLLAAYPDW
jgi:putative MFS transporter